MSTLQATNLKHGSSASNNLVLDANGNVTAAGTVAMATPFAMRNKIINGAMEIDQRGAGASAALSGSAAYPVDRFICYTSSGSGNTGIRSTTVPDGFLNSLLITVGTGAAPSASSYNQIGQIVEGFNAVEFGFGKSWAKQITLSFWARASITGTYCVSFINSSAAGTRRSYVAEYTISSANTWERKTITITADTSGTWYYDNGQGVAIFWDIGSGSNYQTTANAWGNGAYFRTSNQTNLIATNGATFYLTGVQLEVGSVATPFERRLFNQELTMCMRYYQKSFTNGTAPYNGYNPGNTGMPRYTGWVRSDGAFITQFIPFLVPMRVPPTINRYYPLSGSAGQGYGGIGNAADANTAITDVDGSQLTEKGWAFYKTGQSGGAVGQIGVHWDTSGAEL